MMSVAAAMVVPVLFAPALVSAAPPLEPTVTATAAVPVALHQQAAEAAPQSLADAESLALGNHPQLLRLRAEVEVARGSAVQAGLYPNPNFGTINPLQFAGDASTYSLGISQQIVTAGKLQLSQAAAYRDVRAAEWAYQQGLFEVLTNVRTQFYTVLLMQERAARLTALAQLAKRSVETSETLQKSGEGTRVDVLQLKIQQRRAEVAARTVILELDGARRRHTVAQGVPDMALTEVRGDFRQLLPDYEETALQSRVIQEHAAIMKANVQVVRQRLLLQRAIAERCPNVLLQGGYQWTAADQNRDQAVLGLFVDVPIFNRNQGNIRSAQANIRSASAARDELTNDLLGELGLALAQYRAATEQVHEFRSDILPLAQETQAAIEQGYVQGEFELLRLLEIQRSLIDAELTYLDSELNRWLAAVRIAGLLQLEHFP